MNLIFGRYKFGRYIWAGNAGTSGIVSALNKFTDHGFLYTQNQQDEYSRFMVEPLRRWQAGV